MNQNDASMRANREWSSRPDDQRFLSLDEMQEHFEVLRGNSRAAVVSSRSIELKPEEGTLKLYGPNGHGYEPTNWSFGQVATLAGAPAGYLRSLPEEMAADCVNYGLKFNRDIENVGVLLSRNGHDTLRAATGPNYGRIWNSEVVSQLRRFAGDGVSGPWKVPGEFGKSVTVTRENTTLYASDRDMFVFLADEEHRISVPNRRDGKSGDMARGIYIWNSEVGAATFGIGLFLMDFVCCNRIVWGMDQYKEITFRHTACAPDRFFYQAKPALERYANSATANVTEAIEAARNDRPADIKEFLSKRFGLRTAEKIQKVHELEENRPIETRWDAVVGATAYARAIEYQDARVEFEKSAGALLTR